MALKSLFMAIDFPVFDVKLLSADSASGAAPSKKRFFAFFGKKNWTGNFF